MGTIPGGEFGLIAALLRAFPVAGPGVRLGPGDDAALLAPPPGEELVATVDEVVEGVHFDARFAPADVGWKALAVNLSDLAAMGSRPRWALLALGVPPGATRARLLGVARGLAACARRYGVAVAGGNVTRAPVLTLAITALGTAPRGAALRRAGARPGDLLLASGTLGDAALGLEPGAPAALRRRQRRPEPRVALGLGLRGIARAAIDVSDGLVQDLGHLCAASRVGAEVRAAALPRSAAARRWAGGRPDPLAAALAGGEDYELLAAVPPARLRAALAAAARAGTPLAVIGEVTRRRGVRVLDEAGRPRPTPPGHDHLRPSRRRPSP